MIGSDGMAMQGADLRSKGMALAFQQSKLQCKGSLAKG